MLKFLNNPFFILGVYSNTKIKERTSHITKIKAYSNVGKSTSFPLDFPTCLTPPKRNDKTIEKALSLINTPKECFNSYLFWLSNSNSIDDTAINYAISGNFDKAVEILSKQSKVTSMINLSVMYYLIKQDSNAIEKAFEVINNHDNLSSFIEFFNSSSGHNIDITAEDVSILYIESLLQYYDINRLYEIFSSLEGDLSEQISYLNVKRATPIIESINQVLFKEKYDRNNKPSFSTLIEKARNITSATDKLRIDLLKTVGEDSNIAQECCSKIASMVRECAIDALSDNLELHEIDKIENIIRNACNISLSDIFKATCEDDFANLNRRRESLEDKEFIDAYGYLCKKYSTYTTSFSISAFGNVASTNGKYICYAIPLIQKMSSRAGVEIGQKLNDNMVAIVINNIHEAFKAFDSWPNEFKTEMIRYQIESMAKGMSTILKQLNFLCDMVNRWDLILSSEISEALFSNQNQLAEIIRNYESQSIEFSNALINISCLDGLLSEYCEWDYKPVDYLPIYRIEINSENEKRKRKEQENQNYNQNPPQTSSNSSSSSSAPQNSSNGGCYIATLVYGDYDHPKVKVLRHFRDNVLLKNNFGKKFVKFYYKYSPGWVQHLKSKKRINRCIRSILNCFVYIYIGKSKMYKSKNFLLFGLMLCGVNIYAEVTDTPTTDTIEIRDSTEIVKTTNVKITATKRIGVSTSDVKMSIANSSRIEKQKSVPEEGISNEISSSNLGSNVDQDTSNSELKYLVEQNSNVDQDTSSSELKSFVEQNSNVDQDTSSSELKSLVEQNSNVDKDTSSSEPKSLVEQNSNIDQDTSSSELKSLVEQNSNVDKDTSSSEPKSLVEQNSNIDQDTSSSELKSLVEQNSNVDKDTSNSEPVTSAESSSSVDQEVFKSESISSVESNDGANSSASNLNYVMIVFIIFLLFVEVINYIKTIKLLKNSDNLLELCNTYKDSINKYQEIFQNSLVNQENDLQKIISLYTLVKENESVPSSDADISEQHEIVKIVADRLSFMKVTMSKMDPNIKGFKQLNKSIIQITNNLQATGYEIIDYLGEDYKEGMKVVATFITDENLDAGKRIITGVIKPQINYKGTMIQSAQITVSQN